MGTTHTVYRNCTPTDEVHFVDKRSSPVDKWEIVPESCPPVGDGISSRLVISSCQTILRGIRGSFAHII